MNKYDCDLNLEDRNSISVLVKRVKENSTVLEFGPANGRMTKYMKEQLDCKVYAVEIDEKAAKDASQYTEKIIVDSIENYTWGKEFESIKFDYIIFADVLEHLYYPEKVLNSVKEFLKGDGSILISIPNIAHNSILINLVKNEFNYSPTGLLDDTHIRFFTKKTFDDLIAKTGYFRTYETAIFLNPENTEFRNSYTDLPEEFSEYLKRLSWGESYQYVYEIKKYHMPLVSDFSIEYKTYTKNFIQLFIDQNKGISEESSIKLPVNQPSEIQEFTFDISNYENITNLRLDPLNDSCVIEIEKLSIIKLDGSEVNVLPKISANDCTHHDKNYFFEYHDPQIYFEDLSSQELKGTISLMANIRYLHISNDALQACVNEIAIDRNFMINQLTQELESQRQELESQRQELESQHQEIERKEQEKNQQIQLMQKHIKDLELHTKNLLALAEYMRLKNRLKRLLPSEIRNKIKMFIIKYKRSHYLMKKIYSYVKVNGLLFTIKQLYNSRMYKSKAVVFHTNDASIKDISIVHDKVSIVIPTHNGLRDLTKLIPQLINQQGFHDIEIIIVDSSSEDGTKEFIKNFSDIKFITIEQKNFSHSYARNLGFDTCSGKVVLFMVQDALPTSNFWLHSFVHIFKKTKLVALSCSQIPNAEADLYTCYGLKQFNDFLDISESKTKITEKYIDNPTYARKLAQLDNVSCLVDANVFKQYKFRGKYAEDLDLGLRLIKDKHRIGMTSEVSVLHSHLRPAYYYMKRAMVETEVVKDMFEKNTEKINLDDQLSDILVTSFVLAFFLNEIKNINSPISFNKFKVSMSNSLDNLLGREYLKDEYSHVHEVLYKYDANIMNVIDVLFKNNIELKKGDLFYSMHHINSEAINFIENKYTLIDEKIISEYILFMLNTYGTWSGVRFGTNKKEYLEKFPFLNGLFEKLGKGV
ncbi:glycosyltransferase [Sulfurimonas aquatica]|uniref:Glycosyltransferase n=1 Tax=Sulfurimonas aquatica TaxID=2672570 RepID=A0A975GBX8_9BACT|nr:glycosyltransferase [Sulfurimonas aquatica]QSZ40927.1 glycosyltransferase [Sulfurimonas aquatica]